MKTNINDIRSTKAKMCNNCIFCFSKCLKCGSLDITVEYQTVEYQKDLHYKYRNKFIDHIYVARLKKRSIGFTPLLKIDCNKCQNKITAIGKINRFNEVLYLKSYNRDNRSKNFRSNSKYYRQAKYLFEIMEKLYMMPTGVGKKMICDSFHVFVDGTKTKIDKLKGDYIKIEWFLYFGENEIYTTNNFSYKKEHRRLKYMMKLKDKPALVP
jgi:hypothetical protein